MTNSENRLLPALYLVPTPIGNMEDITIRAINTLKQADIIACEDTRRTGLLLKSLDIEHKKLISYHDHNEQKRSIQLIGFLNDGKSIALVSDAGSPLISDPGFRIVNMCIAENIRIIPLPGPSAILPALAASGMAVDKFTFLGFPPAKKGRQTFLKMAANINNTIILYESPYKLLKLLEQLLLYFDAETRICIAREISKIYEEFIRGTLESCLKEIKNRDSVKGELVVIIENRKKR